MRCTALALAVCACGGSAGAPDAGDAGSDARYGHKGLDSGGFDATEEVAPTPWARMESHGGKVIGAMHLHALYIADVNGPPIDRTALLGWILSSPDYWSVLSQYGVGYGTLGGSSTVDVMTFFGMVPTGKVGYADVAAAVAHVAATLPPDEGGAPNAFIVFLPGTADVDFGDGNCGSTLGYHSYVDTTPYAVVRPCGEGGVTISHELAEMATDPIPYAGWYSDDDQANGGGEIGDLCNFPTIVDGYTVTELWSNADGQCEPP